MPDPRLQTALTAAEDELAHLRGLLALTAAFIHNPTWDPAARHALAEALELPAPTEQT